MLCDAYLVLVLGVLNNSTIPGYLTWIKPYNHIILSNLKHVSTLPYYVTILNGIFSNFFFFKETTNSDKVEIKDELVLNGMTWEAVGNI